MKVVDSRDHYGRRVWRTIALLHTPVDVENPY